MAILTDRDCDDDVTINGKSALGGYSTMKS